MNFAEHVREEARLKVLVCLSNAPQSTAADVLLHKALQDDGVYVAMASLRVELAWLNEQGCVVTQRPGGASGMMIATLTERGLDVAQGLSFPPGVARPRPGG